MKARFIALWASLFVGALLWFSLGTGFQKGTLSCFGERKPDIVGVWSFDLTDQVASEVVITDTHIDWMGRSIEYKAHYEGRLIVVTSPIPEQTNVPPGLSEDVLFLIKKNGKEMRVVAVGLATDITFTKVDKEVPLL